jgi:hypothetical protein
VGVGDDELYASEPSAGELAQERRPERLGFGRADVQAQHLPPAVAVRPHRHDDGDRHDPALLAHLHIGGVDPEVRPIALDRPVEKGVHPFVDLLA